MWREECRQAVDGAMTKTVVIHQPDFLSYLGFFHRLLFADVFVVLDTAQFVSGTSRSWTNRDKIKTPRGEQWITVGVKKAPGNTAIREIELADSDWKDGNLNLIKENYRRAAYFDEIFPHIEKLYTSGDRLLMDFNLKSIDMLMSLLDVRIPMLLASTVEPQGKKNELLLDILKKVGATHYLSGVGARGYLVPEVFEEAGIQVSWQQFAHPTYAQLHGEFIPYLSSVDLLLNCGIDGSRRILRSC
jgi:hypothetical protein